MKKFESERNTLFSVILGHTLNVNQFSNVILGFIPRIHAKHSPLLDTRDTTEYDNRKNFTKGLNVVCQCAALLERLKTHIKIHSLFCHPRAWLLARPEDLDSRVKPENDYKDLLPQCAPDTTGFLSDVYKRGTRAQKFLVDGVQCGRSMIEMLGVLAIIGVLSVGGIAGYSKAMMKFKINKTMQQIAEIATNVRTLYAQQKDFNGLNNETAVQMGIVPDSLTTSTGLYNTTISNVFSDDIRISSAYTYRPSYSYGDAFDIIFYNLEKEACIALGTANWGTIETSGVVGITIGNLSNFLERALYAGNGSCTKGDFYNDAYYACSGSLPLSPATAAEYCENKGEYRGFRIMFTK